MPRIRTGYSFRTAVGHLPEVLDRIIELGWEAAPITDRDSTFGFSNWTKFCEKKGIRPVYGVELGVVENIAEKLPSPSYWTFFALDDLRSLHDLITKASSRGMELLLEDAVNARGVVAVAGERSSIEKLPPGTKVFLSPSTSIGFYRQARKKGLVFVASSDNMYTNRGDLEFYRVALGNMKSSSQTYPQHVLADEEWRQAVSWFAEVADMEEGIENRNAILHACRAKLKPAELLVPEKPKDLRQLCVEGAEALGINLKDPTYKKRLDHELKMIYEKKFEDYFHVLADIIGYSKKHMIVGPGRGSSSGSLVCCLIGITTIDPIPHGLMFERFIDVTRNDLPDIDVDFSDEKRFMAFEYAEKKYGKERVARLGSVGTFQAKSALKQAANALRIPPWKIEKVGASVITRSAGDSRAGNSIEDTLTTTDAGKSLVQEYPEIKIVQRLEDHPTVQGQHAAGIVITQLPVSEHVAVDLRTGATMCDKYDADQLNLLKIDALGLTQLSVFERTLELIGKPSVSGFLETLSLDDPAAFEVLNQRHYAGVFQFVGKSVRLMAEKLVRGAKFDRFDDIVSLTALARPGPLGSGMADEWIRRRTGLRPITYIHPAFEPYLKDTQGVVIYQEQVMAICRELGDLSWGEVNELRRAMSKSLGKEFFDKFGDKWKEGAAKKGIDKATLDKVWEELVNFGAMGFNKAHSVSYGVVSYWCLWLKAHYPVEFAAATLDSQSDPADQIGTLRELREEGIEYVSVDPDNSIDRWTRVEREGKTILVGPLTSIKGIGPKSVIEILEARKNGTPLKPGLIKKLTEARTEIDSLYPIRDATLRLFKEAAEKKAELEVRKDLSVEETEALRHASLVLNIETKPIDIAELNKNGRDYNEKEVMIICVFTKMDQLDENELLRVQKRGGKKVFGPTEALQIFAKDDSGEMFCKVSRYDFEAHGRAISERGAVGKAVYALKGRMWADGDFGMMWVKRARYMGDLR
jgi:DNA polymerase III alpha subunit